MALAAVFGPPSAGSYFERKPGAPELEMIVSDREYPPAIDNWHSDISRKPNPPLGTAIQITETPPAGGNTCWSSTSKAYDWLSPGLKKYLEGAQRRRVERKLPCGKAKALCGKVGSHDGLTPIKKGGRLTAPAQIKA